MSGVHAGKRGAGACVDPHDIAEHIWNYDTFNHANVVDVYIRNLRRKPDDDFTPKLTHTVRGAGSRLSIEEAGTLLRRQISSSNLQGIVARQRRGHWRRYRTPPIERR